LSSLTFLGVARITLALFSDLYKVTYQISPPPFSQFGTCSVSYLDITTNLDTADGFLVLAFDSEVFALTIAKTWQLYQQCKMVSRNWRSNLAAVLLHDGITYYCCVEVLTIANVCLNLTPSASIIVVVTVSIFQNVLASILTNRLVLNLRQAGNLHMQDETSTLPSLAFAANSFVGNLGAPFRVREDDEDTELDDLDHNEHEIREQNLEGQPALIVEDA